MHLTEEPQQAEFRRITTSPIVDVYAKFQDGAFIVHNMAASSQAAKAAARCAVYARTDAIIVVFAEMPDFVAVYTVKQLRDCICVAT